MPRTYLRSRLPRARGDRRRRRLDATRPPRSPSATLARGLLQIPHSGLATARNEGFRAARGELVAYLDADAYPTPEWPYYLALALDRPDVGGVGGPNLPPRDDPPGAQVVARAPGGPVHVLTSDDRAEHVPGCNMAFWKIVLEEVDGFDPVYTAAGDDVDLCWRRSTAAGRSAFTRPRSSGTTGARACATYLRQQRDVRPQRGTRGGAAPRALHRRRNRALAGPDLQLVDAVDRSRSGSTEACTAPRPTSPCIEAAVTCWISCTRLGCRSRRCRC